MGTKLRLIGRIHKVCSADAYVQFNINSAQANDLDIALPPLSEQAKFVEIANKILKNKDSHIKSLEKNNLLFSSLQNQAFNGTL